MCCGGGRSPSPVRGPIGGATMRAGPAPGGAPHPAPPSGPVRLTYHGTRPATVIGPVTGRRYRLDPGAPGVEIDPRDQRGLLATTRFTRAG
jgi:hypothetical protein